MTIAESTTLHSRLLAICNLTSQVRMPGIFADDTGPWWDAAGLSEYPHAITAGDFAINAALLGRIEHEDQPKTFVCFRGTLAFNDQNATENQKSLDWIGDFHGLLVGWRGMPGRVHEGFSASLESLEGQIELFAQESPPRIYCGHSKGGAMAQLAAFYYCQTRARPCVCVTFGAPRVADAAFASAFDESGVSLVRYENHGDVVPMVPFDPRAGMILATAFGKTLPVADYHSLGDVSYIGPDGSISRFYTDLGKLECNGEQLLGIASTFARGGFEGIVQAHGIDMNHGYSRAVAPEVHRAS